MPCAGEVMHLNASVGEEIMDKVLWSPSSRTILFDVSDHWHLVEAVASALIEIDSLSQTRVHQIIHAGEAQPRPQARRIGRTWVKKLAGRAGLAG